MISSIDPLENGSPTPTPHPRSSHEDKDEFEPTDADLAQLAEDILRYDPDLAGLLAAAGAAKMLKGVKSGGASPILA
ncbi:MAG: hypothetical protein R3F11_31670 [Verrucomicrobiales bacterium]